MTAAIQSVEQPNQIFDLLIKLDQGLCNPVQVTRKQLEADEKEAWITARELAVKNQGEEGQAPLKDEELQESTLVKKKKVFMFKFWPKDLLRNAWTNYISQVDESE